MARVLHRFSDIACKAKKRPGYSADGGNPYLRVAPGGSKGWIFRSTMGGRTRDAGLGPYLTVSLVKARIEAVVFGIPILPRVRLTGRCEVSTVLMISSFSGCGVSHATFSPSAITLF